MTCRTKLMPITATGRVRDLQRERLIRRMADTIAQVADARGGIAHVTTADLQAEAFTIAQINAYMVAARARAMARDRRHPAPRDGEAGSAVA